MASRLRGIWGIYLFDWHETDDSPTLARRQSAKVPPVKSCDPVSQKDYLFGKGSLHRDSLGLLEVSLFVNDDDSVCIQQTVNDKAGDG